MRRQKSLHVVLLLIVLFSLTGFAPSRQDPQLNIRITQLDTSEFPKVTVFVSITDAAGEPVGVAAERIRIAENGLEIPPDQIQAAGEVTALTTLLVVDISSSMLRVGKLDAAKTAAAEFVSQLRPGDKVGLLAFNQQFEYAQPITNDMELILQAVDSLEAEGDTALYDALSQAISELNAIEGRKAIVALTDGIDNISQATPDSVLAQIDPEGLSISTIGLGNPDEGPADVTGLDEAALRYLADNAGGIYGYANDVESLNELYRSYAVAFKSEYQLTYISPSDLKDGVNRALSVYLVDAPVVGSASDAGAIVYNPGGLVPEVTQAAPWPIFGLVLLTLAVLLFLPTLVSRINSSEVAARAALGSGKKKKSRIKLKD